jgi:hypothetical protein
MFVYFMQWDTDRKTCNYLFDVPTIVSSIWNRAQDQKVLQVNIEQELLDFQNHLIYLISNNPVTAAKVRIISTPCFPVDIDTMKSSAITFVK